VHYGGIKMGFFSRLFGGGSKPQSSGFAPQQYHRPMSNAPRNAPSQNLAADVMSILQTEFSRYEIATNVSVQTLVPEAQYGGPIDFTLSQNGKIVAVIVLIPKGKFYTKRIWGVEKTCVHLGIPMLRLYYHFGFDRAKVVSYIGRNLSQ